jgi:hypothetical protein
MLKHKKEVSALDLHKEELDDMKLVFRITLEHEIKETKNEAAIKEGWSIWKEIKACEVTTAATIERINRTIDLVQQYVLKYN